MDSLADKKLVVDKIRNFVFNEIPHAKWGEDKPQRFLIFRTLLAFPFRRHEGSVNLKFTNYKDKGNDECLERFVLVIDESEIRLSYSDENEYDNYCYHLEGDHDDYKDMDWEEWIRQVEAGLVANELELEVEGGLKLLSKKTGYECLQDRYESEGLKQAEYDPNYADSVITESNSNYFVFKDSNGYGVKDDVGDILEEGLTSEPEYWGKEVDRVSFYIGDKNHDRIYDEIGGEVIWGDFKVIENKDEYLVLKDMDGLVSNLYEAE